MNVPSGFFVVVAAAGHVLSQMHERFTGGAEEGRGIVCTDRERRVLSMFLRILRLAEENSYTRNLLRQGVFLADPWLQLLYNMPHPEFITTEKPLEAVNRNLLGVYGLVNELLCSTDEVSLDQGTLVRINQIAAACNELYLTAGVSSILQLMRMEWELELLTQELSSGTAVPERMQRNFYANLTLLCSQQYKESDPRDYYPVVRGRIKEAMAAQGYPCSSDAGLNQRLRDARATLVEMTHISSLGYVHYPQQVLKRRVADIQCAISETRLYLLKAVGAVKQRLIDDGWSEQTIDHHHVDL